MDGGNPFVSSVVDQLFANTVIQNTVVKCVHACQEKGEMEFPQKMTWSSRHVVPDNKSEGKLTEEKLTEEDELHGGSVYNFESV